MTGVSSEVKSVALQLAKRRGGRLNYSGAIAGSISFLYLRGMYLKDISLIGATAWDEPVFPKLTQDIEDGEIWPLFAAILLLDDIAAA